MTWLEIILLIALALSVIIQLPWLIVIGRENGQVRRLAREKGRFGVSDQGRLYFIFADEEEHQQGIRHRHPLERYLPAAYRRACLKEQARDYNVPELVPSTTPVLEVESEPKQGDWR